MSDPLDGTNEKPSLNSLQFLQDNWDRDEINVAQRTLKVTVATGGNAGVEADIPLGAEIIGVTVICTRTTGGGTMQVMTGATVPVAISDAIVCAVNDTITYAGSIDTTNSRVGADGIEVYANAAADGGIVFIHYLVSV